MDTQFPYTRGSRYTSPRSAPAPVPAQVRRVTVAVNGLHYEHSPVGLAHQLHGNPGIVDVAVDTRAGTALITFDETRLSEDAVIHLVSECGYELGRRDIASAKLVPGERSRARGD